jgi:hypothetical protein
MKAQYENNSEIMNNINNNINIGKPAKMTLGERLFRRTDNHATGFIALVNGDGAIGDCTAIHLQPLYLPALALSLRFAHLSWLSAVFFIA